MVLLVSVVGAGVVVVVVGSAAVDAVVVGLVPVVSLRVLSARS